MRFARLSPCRDRNRLPTRLKVRNPRRVILCPHPMNLSTAERSAPSWREALIARMRVEAQPPEKFSHQARLYALAREIAAAGHDPVDDDVLFAAAWAHDLGVFLGHRPGNTEALRQWDATAYTVAHAGPLLAGCGFLAEKICAALECIRTHEAHGQPTTPEGWILRDADLLEQLGAIAVMRTTAKIAQDTRFITFADAAASLRNALQTVPQQIHLPQTRALAEPRIITLRMFLEALEAESQGNLA